MLGGSFFPWFGVGRRSCSSFKDPGQRLGQSMRRGGRGSSQTDGVLKGGLAASSTALGNLREPCRNCGALPKIHYTTMIPMAVVSKIMQHFHHQQYQTYSKAQVRVRGLLRRARRAGVAPGQASQVRATGANM